MKIFSRIRTGISGNNKPDDSQEYTHRAYFSKLGEIDSYTVQLNDPSLATVETNLDIVFSRHLTFGMPHSTFTNKLGKPVQQVRESLPFKRRILYYKFKMGGHKARCELHFYNDNLFFYCYTFPYLSEECKTEILDILREKYMDHKADISKCKITDKNNHVIFISDMTVLTVNYLDTGCELFNRSNPVLFPGTENAGKKTLNYQREIYRML